MHPRNAVTVRWRYFIAVRQEKQKAWKNFEIRVSPLQEVGLIDATTAVFCIAHSFLLVPCSGAVFYNEQLQAVSCGLT